FISTTTSTRPRWRSARPGRPPRPISVSDDGPRSRALVPLLTIFNLPLEYPRMTVVRMCVSLAALGVASAGLSAQLPIGPPRQFGAGVTGAFEGWFENPDGSRSFLVGYLNRNFEQELDVPIGPNNRIEPG